MIEKSVPSLLRDVGTELDDLDIAWGTEGRLTQNRVVRGADAAADKVWAAARNEGVNPLAFKDEVSLAVDPADEDRYPLPPRTRQVILVQDDDKEYEPLQTYQTNRTGYVTEEGCRAIRLRNVDSISGTLVAWVVQKPPMLHCSIISGKSSTTVTFATVPTVGGIVNEDDYYVGAKVALVAGTVGINQIRTISDFVGATRVATVPAWTTNPTTSTSAISILLGLPDALVRSVVLRTALQVARTDQKMRDFYKDIQAEYVSEFQHALEVLDQANIPLVKTPRQVHDPGIDWTGRYT